MVDQWLNRILQVTEASLSASIAEVEAPESIRYKGRIYRKQSDILKGTADYTVRTVTPSSYEYVLVPYVQYIQEVPSLSYDAPFTLRLEVNPVAPSSIKLYAKQPFSTEPLLIGEDDGQGSILPRRWGYISNGNIYYNDGELTLQLTGQFYTTSGDGSAVLAVYYNRLEVKQAYHKSARGGSIKSIQADELDIDE